MPILRLISYSLCACFACAPLHAQTPSNTAAVPSQKTATENSESSDTPGEDSFNVELDFNSRYVFRGQAFSSGAVFQPTISWSHRDYTTSIFANRSRGRFDEFDVAIAKTIERGHTTIEPSAVMYLYPRGGESSAPTTGEIGMRVAHLNGKTTLYTQHFVDVWQYPGAYLAEFGVSHEQTWNKRLSSEIGARLALGNATYSAANICLRRGGAVFAALDFSLSYALNERFYLRPHLELSRILDSKLRAQIDEPDLWTLGVTVGTDF